MIALIILVALGILLVIVWVKLQTDLHRKDFISANLPVKSFKLSHYGPTFGPFYAPPTLTEDWLVEVSDGRQFRVTRLYRDRESVKIYTPIVGEKLDMKFMWFPTH